LTGKNRIRIYADTSVFGGVFDAEFVKASSAFIDQVRAGKFHLVISPLVEKEISIASANVLDFYHSVVPLTERLPVTEAAIRLQDAYLEAGIISPRWSSDALHVAYATVSGCQMIVSWNFRHIVHYQKIGLYNAINIKEGYFNIGIHSPQEVIEYEEEGL